MDNSEKIVCPYNRLHLINKYKFIWHFTRCKDQYKTHKKYRLCRFN